MQTPPPSKLLAYQLSHSTHLHVPWTGFRWPQFSSVGSGRAEPQGRGWSKLLSEARVVTWPETQGRAPECL